MATQTTPATRPPPQMATESRDARFLGQAGIMRDAGLAHATHVEMGSPANLREPGAAGSHLASSLVANGGLGRGGAHGGDARAEAEEGLENSGFLRLTPAIERLPVEMTVAIPIRKFRVRDLLAMDPGMVIETQWTPSEDLPLASGEVQLAWSEFEVVDTRLAVRVTRLG